MPQARLERALVLLATARAQPPRPAHHVVLPRARQHVAALAVRLHALAAALVLRPAADVLVAVGAAQRPLAVALAVRPLTRVLAAVGVRERALAVRRVAAPRAHVALAGRVVLLAVPLALERRARVRDGAKQLALVPTARGERAHGGPIERVPLKLARDRVAVAQRQQAAALGLVLHECAREQRAAVEEAQRALARHPAVGPAARVLAHRGRAG
mmetsp:Transcript_32939/g.97058  ORF Transcript_32939/g.97058 Transcript_32939/m.97058 type:complete len:214 (-) Transcript_32939:157-798(-)